MGFMGIDTLISAAGFSVGLMLAGLVASAPKQVAPGGRWLAAALLCFALLSLSDCLESSRLILKSPHLGHIFDPLSLLLGPLLLAYVHTLTGRALPPWPRALTHTIPLLLVTTLLVPFYLMSSAEKRATLELDLSQQAAIDPILAVVAIIFFCYLVAALRLLSRYRRELPDNYSSLEQRTYRLIGAMLWILSGLWIIFVLAVVGAGEWAQWLNRVAVPVAMYGLGWFGLRQRLVRIDHQPAATTMTMLKPTETSEVPTVEATTPANAPAFTHSIVAPVPPVGTDSPPKYQRSGLTTERAAFYRTRLEESMAKIGRAHV